MNFNLFLEHENFVYTRLQAIIWKYNGLGFPHVIEKNSGKFLAESLVNYRTDYPLVINCKGVRNIDDHALDDLVTDLKVKKRCLILVNVKKLIEFKQSGLDDILKNAKIEYRYDPEGDHLIVGKEEKIDVNDIINSAEVMMNKKTKKVVESCFVEYPSSVEPKRLSSTPITANGEFDSRKIIFNPEYFIWINILLSDILERVLESSSSTNPFRLLSVSLRGSPFAAALSALLGITFDSIDHLGPKHKLFDVDFIDQYIKGINYIYVGDFTIGGTEIKIAQTYAQILGCKLHHALVIGSYLSNEAFKDNFELKFLVSLRDYSQIKFGF
jgi:hypothetical protein